MLCKVLINLNASVHHNLKIENAFALCQLEIVRNNWDTVVLLD